MADRMAVMYAGNVVEYTDAPRLFAQPKHPYTVGLLNCYPDVQAPRKIQEAIEGVVPDLINPPTGVGFTRGANTPCRFVGRKSHASQQLVMDIWWVVICLTRHEGANHVRKGLDGKAGSPWRRP
jgi:oligopeptide/dipeptide ABC transporter ATP-binding protein